MAIEEYRIWAGVDAPDDGQIGTTVGTQVAVASSSGLLWYLKKAGITVAPPAPTTGRGYPRGTA